jgi:surfactin synthase thioesterase subunit
LVAFDLAKLLEERFDSVKLILLDKSVNDDTEVSSVETNELDDYIENLLTQLHEIDTTIAHTAYIKRVKKLYEHNLNLAEKYIHQGKLKVNIIALEAKDNTPKTEMKKWGHFTSGEFSHQYIQGEHYTLLNPEYLIELASIIQDFLK